MATDTEVVAITAATIQQMIAQGWTFEWDEEAHPRGEGGKFGGGGGESGFGGRQVSTPIKDGNQFKYPDGSRGIPGNMVGKAAIRDLPGQDATNSQMDRRFAPWAERLSDEEKEALTNYQVGSYRLNMGLRSGKIDATVSDIDSAIAKGNTGNSATATYRVTTSGFADGLKLGDKITDSAYLSTSTSLQAAREFAEIEEESGDRTEMIKIVVPAGSNGAWIDSASSTGQISQSELLLPRNTSLLYMGKNDDDMHVFMAGERR